MFPAPPNFSAAVHPLPPFSFSPSAPFPNPSQQSFLPQDPLHQGTADPNSLEAFKNNLRIVEQQVLEVQSLARRVLTMIQHAYQTGNSPVHTEADITSLKQMLALVNESMKQSGVGALPMLPTTGGIPTGVPSEAQLLAGTSQNLHTLYEKLSKSQESAAVAANLLSMDHSSARVAGQR